MDVEHSRRITLIVPTLEDFEEDDSCIPVPHDTVCATIEMLQGCIAQWKSEIGCETDEERWRALMAAAGLALGKLVEAYAVHYTAAGAQRLLHQISWFLNYGEVREHLEAARGGVTLIGESTDHIVDALLGLREEEERRRKARMSQRGASRPEPASQEQQEEQEVAGQDDAGWDF